MVKNIKRRIKRSFLWKIPQHELIEKVKTATSLSEVLKAYGLENKGGNSHTLKRRLKEESIDFSHINLGVGSNKGRKFWEVNLMTLDECLKHMFVEKSPYNRSTIKRYLRRYNLISYACSECHGGDEWNGKPLKLQLDHQNGISDDNRLGNLRWVCPNCHTQTPTFAGRRSKY